MSRSGDFRVVFDKDDIAAIRRIAKAEPRAVVRAWSAVISQAANALRKELRTGGGGKHRVPSFPPRDTTMFRPRSQWAGCLGGESLKNTIIRRVAGPVAVIGFNPDTPAALKFGDAFQTFLGRAWTPRERNFLHRALGVRHIVINDKVRQPRPMIVGFADYLRVWLPGEMRKTAEKRYKQMLKKRSAKK